MPDAFVAPPVFVISLARAAERRAGMVMHLDNQNIQHEIIDAVDGATLDLSAYKDRLNPKLSQKLHGAPLNTGEIGCYLSHYQLWERIVAESIPYAVILEDNVRCNEDFMNVVADIVRCPWLWDVVLLHAGFRRVHRVVSPIAEKYRLLQYKRFWVGTKGYCITLSAARKLINHCRVMLYPVDLAWQDYWKWNGRFYCINPPVVTISGEDSLIDGIESRRMAIMKNRQFSLISKLSLKRHEFVRSFYYHFRRPSMKP